MHYFRDVHNTIFLSFDVEGSEKVWKSGEEIESFDGAEFAFLKISQNWNGGRVMAFLSPLPPRFRQAGIVRANVECANTYVRN